MHNFVYLHDNEFLFLHYHVSTMMIYFEIQIWKSWWRHQFWRRHKNTIRLKVQNSMMTSLLERAFLGCTLNNFKNGYWITSFQNLPTNLQFLVQKRKSHLKCWSYNCLVLAAASASEPHYWKFLEVWVIVTSPNFPNLKIMK